MATGMWKRFLAMTLSVIMVSGVLTDTLPAVLAADTGEPAAETGLSTGDHLDFSNPDNGRPNLYVDFLGDNWYYNADPAKRIGLPAQAPATPDVPGAYDQSAKTNPDTVPKPDDPTQTVSTGTNNIWSGYESLEFAGSIFWVGVGVDRTQVLKLLEGGRGLTSLELGFYYNEKYLEPYTGGRDYATVITEANINNAAYPENTRWSDCYSILHAETGLDVQMEPVTQEPVKGPTLEEIANNTPAALDPHDIPNWKMTYISLELKDTAMARRLAGDDVYDASYFETDDDGNPAPTSGQAPEAASGTNGPEYLLLIPFVLKDYDVYDKLCLRLARNATHFSIGGGPDGTGPYGAWERVTTRNPGKELKLMTNFTGDLNIFTGEKVKDDTSAARLKIVNGGGSQNKAKLSVDGDPAVWPVYADTNGEVIEGLKGGIGMQVDIHCQSGYKVTVAVYEGSEEPKPEQINNPIQTVSYTVVRDQEHYTFVMPDETATKTVLVVVRFENDDRDEYTVYLSEIFKGETTRQMGNTARVTAADGSELVSYLFPVSEDDHPGHPAAGVEHESGPVGEAQKGKDTTITVTTHEDYVAKVRVYNFAEEVWLTTYAAGSITGGSVSSAGVVTLNAGGSVKFTMPSTDIDVEVTYEPATKYRADLMVTHEGDTPVHADNTAQLAYLSYDSMNEPHTAYSGQVYHDYVEEVPGANEGDPPATAGVNNERALKDPGKIITWIPMSAAAMSGSLGGDTGRTGRAWSTSDDPVTGPSAIMSQLYSAANEGALAAALDGLDFSKAQVTANVEGLRKNADGEFYGDDQAGADMTAVAKLLWEIRTLILNDSALRTAYVKSVPKSDTDSTTAYNYFDVTAAQVQAYALEMGQADKIYRDSVAAYRELYTAYLGAKRVYDQAVAKGITAATKPTSPQPPRGWDTTTGVRTYEGGDYIAKYYAGYQKYLNGDAAAATPTTGYLDYINLVNTGTLETVPAYSGPTPEDRPDLVKMALLSDTDAQTAVETAAARWDARTHSGKNYIETRDGRTVWVALEANSGYEATVEVWHVTTDSDGNVTTTTQFDPADIDLKAPDGFVNVYTFTMPAEPCMVRVVYREREFANLEWNVTGAGGNSDNLTTITAYERDPNSTVPIRDQKSNAGSQNVANFQGATFRDIFQESQVTIQIKTGDNYSATVSVINTDTGGTISLPTPVDAPNPADGKIYTLTVPAGCTGLKVTTSYEPKDVPLHKATIRGVNYDANNDGRNQVHWDDGSTVKNDVPMDELLSGQVSVAPGYYIYAVTASGASGSYTYTLGGNGYNNGHGTFMDDGTGTLADHPLPIGTTMPDEDLLVTVVYRKGIPTVEPANALTLQVVDDANTDETKADNWAKATVERGGATVDTLGAVGLGTTGDGALSDSGYASAGDVVTVEYSAVVVKNAEGKVDQDKSYYVSSITVGPESLGVQFQWLPGNKVQFVMPAGSTGVTVTFQRGVAPAYFLDAVRLENGSMTITELENKITKAQSETIRSFRNTTDVYDLVQTITKDPGPPEVVLDTPYAQNPETIPDVAKYGAGQGAATAGEKVTMTFQAQDGWYVQAVTVETSQTSWSVPFTVVTGRNDGVAGSGKTTFTAEFTMPASDADFVVQYRKGPKPTVPEYAVNVRLLDEDNVADAATGVAVADNWLQAAAGTQNSGKLGLLQGTPPPTMRGLLYPQAGEVVTLDYTLQSGFTMDYIVVTPSGLRIFPSYVSVVTDAATGVTTGQAQFTMPAENVTVTASVIKSAPREYTANLILRMPTGAAIPADLTIDEVGQGTFLTGGGSLADYWKNALYSLTAPAGTPVDVGLYAFDGYYIRAVTIDPAVGATASLTGAFGHQNSSFVMPAANINVNVWFEKGWPDEVQYDLTLEVFDAAFRQSDYDADTAADKDANYNYAAFRTAGTVTLDGQHVFGGGTKTIPAAAFDRDTVVVDIHTAPGFHVSEDTIQVHDSGGNVIPWRYVVGGLAFTMPPRATKVTVKFLKSGTGTPGDPSPAPQTYEATLHLMDVGTGDTASLATDNASALGGPVNADGASITKLSAGDAMTLSAVHGTGRHIAAAYAVKRSTGEQIMLPVTLVRDGTDPVTNLPVGTFAMPDDDADVYVLYAPDGGDTDPDPDDPDPSGRDNAVNLIVSGEAGPAAKPNRATMRRNGSITLGAGMVQVTASGAASLMAATNDAMKVTLDVADGYYISTLTVTNAAGDSLDYDWISMLENDDPEPSVWYPNPDREISFTVPAGGGTVYVRYEKTPVTPPTPDDPDPDALRYTAQVVVNNEAYTDTVIPSRNDAGFPKDVPREDGAGNPVLDGGGNQIVDHVLERLRPAQAGEWVDLELTVHEGYMIEYIKVVPQEFGIVPTLYLTPMDSQSTGFVMPAGDVTVYVKFVTDGLTRYNATLVVDGAPDRPENNAQITSGYTGTKGPITPDDTPVSVRAAAGREWVTVDYTWYEGTPDLDPSDPNYIPPNSVASVTVKDLAGNDVPFTQVDPKQITLPMVAKDIIITVTYRPDPEPVGYDVVLHVIDKDGKPVITGPLDPDDDTQSNWNTNYAQVTYDPAAPYNDPDAGAYATTGRVAPATGKGNSATIQAPAGKLVDLTVNSDIADAGGKVFIHSAYVLYEHGGQMIRCNLTPDDKENPARPGPGFSGHKTSQFAVHPGRNDVYVTLTRQDPETDKDEFSAVLMLKGAGSDLTSHASICVGTDYTNASRKDSLTINDPDKSHAYVTATRREDITVSVYPAPGYVVDYVLMTPLGDPTNPTPVRMDNTYSFKMPGHNVAITVFLKEKNDNNYRATLHFTQVGSTATTDGVDTAKVERANRAELAWTPDGAASPEVIRAYAETSASAAGDPSMEVAERSTVTVRATLDDPYTVLAAYVLRGTVLVPLGPSLEGGVEGASLGDNTKTDVSAHFTMPSGNVDVYLVVTDDPPANPDWHTAVLTVSDKAGNLENVGQNGAYIEDDVTPPNQREAVTGQVDNSTTPPTVKPKLGHEYLTVWAGQTVTTTVKPAQPGYSFNRPATISHSVGGVSTALGSTTGLTETRQSPYTYTYTVGNYNSAVAVNFTEADAAENDLTVIIEDDDNPGNGTVTNTVVAAPTDMTALDLRSVSSAGAYQVIPKVAEGKTVAITAKPQSGLPDGETYYAYATYEDANFETGAAPTPIVPFDRQSDGTYTASITMPAVAATVTVHFYRGYTGTLTIVDRNLKDPTSTAEMTEDFRDQLVEVDNVVPQNSIPGLPHKTELAAHMTRLEPTGHLAGVVVTERGSSWLLSATDVDGNTPAPSDDVTQQYYRHAINRADAEITFVVAGKDADDQSHVATVRTVNKPDTTPAPDIVNTTYAAAWGGDIWTLAKKDDKLTVTADVPEHYEARVTARTVDSTPVDLDDPASAATPPATAQTVTLPAGAGGTVHFTMPNANVEVTVEYVKVEFSLTLRIQGETWADATITPHTSADPDAVISGTDPLTADGDSAIVAQGTDVAVKADPSTAAGQEGKIAGVLLRTAGGATTFLTGSTESAFNGHFAMPQDDAVLTVIYAPKAKGPEPDPEEYFIASTAAEGTDGLPGNAIVSIANETVNTLPASSPDWAAGRRKDEIKVSFTTDPGYWASVTAEKVGGGTVTVVQQGITGSCTATIQMPGSDVVITVTYHKYGLDDPPAEDKTLDMALRLVGHGEEEDNAAIVTGGSLTGLALDGTDATTAAAATTAPGAYDPVLAVAGDATSPIRVTKQSSNTGDRLLISADWAKGYQIERVTVSVPDATAPGGIVESEIPLNRYGSNAAARLYMPGKDAMVTVYYVNIYTVTLHVVGATGNDKTQTTDDRTDTVTSLGAGTEVITRTGEQLWYLKGGESVQTEAIPDTDNGKRLVGVVYESDRTGAGATVIRQDTSVSPAQNTDWHDFAMPKADTDVYAVYEKEPDDPKDRSYIAKAAIHPDSQGVGVTGNGLAIQNETDTKAAHGKYWTAAKAGETVTITVNLAPGYQAVVTSAIIDDAGKRPAGITDADKFHYYVTRTAFVVTGKTTTFTMPAESDATVTVKFVKGYKLALSVTDKSGLADNLGKVSVPDPASTETPPKTLDLQGVSADTAGTITYTPNDPTLLGLAGGTQVTSTVTPVNANIPTRVLYQTPFGGTVTVRKDTDGSYKPYGLPQEDTLESILFRDETSTDDLLAKVQLKGESDINGNTSQGIIDAGTPPLATTTGTIWTTTDGGRTVDVSFTVARGYIAKLKVLRDDSTVDDSGNPVPEEDWVFLDAAAYGFTMKTTYDDAGTAKSDTKVYTAAANVGTEIVQGFLKGTRTAPPAEVVMDPYISDVQHFTFTMPETRAASGTEGADDYKPGDTETDVTVIIEYIYAGTIPAPYDPDNAARNTDAVLDKGYIYAENRGSYAFVDIPTLEQDGTLYNTDTYKSDKVHFRFFLYDGDTDVYTELITGTDVDLAPYDPAGLANAGDPYNYYDYTYTTPDPDVTYTGSRFTMTPKAGTGGALTSGGTALQKMLNNEGALDKDSNKTRLYVLAENELGEQSAYTQVWIRPHYTLAIDVVSYGPAHPITGTLYPLTDGGDEMDFAAYSATAAFTETLEPVDGEDKWRQTVTIQSSELLGDLENDPTATPPTYALTLEKASNLTYTRVALTLDPNDPNYDADTKTFKVGGRVTLIAGDVDGDGMTKWSDHEFIRQYVERAKPWDNTDDPTDAYWNISTRNPDTWQYRCDLNSDGMLSIVDLNVLTTYKNYNRDTSDYLWENQDGTLVLPHGLAAPASDVVTYFSAGTWEDGPAPYDPVEDAQVTPQELLAEAGRPVQSDETPQEPPASDETPEVPAEEWEMPADAPVAQPALPQLPPEDPADVPEPLWPAQPPEDRKDPDGPEPEDEPDET